MKLHIQPYRDQVLRWPTTGHHILAQFDEHSIIVYQAYRPAIGHFAATHGYFGGEFSFNRMSWIKPNFLWMMYRSGWGTKDGQDVTLAVRLKRVAFDIILEQAVYSSFAPHIYASEAAWSQAVTESSVRLQWDPDHDPAGKKSTRRAIQLGLRGDVLRQYAREWIIDIEDISAFVEQQRVNAQAESAYEHLLTPCEEVYPVVDSNVATKLGIATHDATANQQVNKSDAPNKALQATPVNVAFFRAGFVRVSRSKAWCSGCGARLSLNVVALRDTFCKLRRLKYRRNGTAESTVEIRHPLFQPALLFNSSCQRERMSMKQC